MEGPPQPQSKTPAADPEEEARRLLAEFERQSRAARERLTAPAGWPVLRALGVLVLLALALGACFLLLHASSTLPALLERSR